MSPKTVSLMGVLLLGVTACGPRIGLPRADRPVPLRGGELSLAPVEELAPISEADSVWIRNRVSEMLFSYYQYLYRGGVELYTRGKCDAGEGDFCLRGDWDTTPCFERALRPWCTEDHEEAEDRSYLLATLDSATIALPGDLWILGQQVYHRGKFRSPGIATQTVRRCAGEEWRCAALQGWQLHLAGAYVDAEIAFDRMLMQMPEEVRCKWTDLSEVYKHEIGGEYGGLSCDERKAINDRVWWLSDPLYLLPGNERWTEHLFRQVSMGLQDEIHFIQGGLRDFNHYEYIIAYGLEDSWNLDNPRLIPDLRSASSFRTNFGIPVFRRATSLASTDLIANPPRSAFRRQVKYSSARYKLTPDWGTVMAPDPTAVTDESWTLEDRDKVEGYTPPGGFFFTDLQYQAGFFMRGDSARVIAVTEVAKTEELEPWDYGAGIYLARSEIDKPVIEYRDFTEDRYVFDETVTIDPHLISLEAIARDRGAGRARFGQAPPFDGAGPIGISDLLVYDPWGWDPVSLEEVVPTVYGRIEFLASDDLALFWEIYGSQPGEDTRFFLSVAEDRGGVLDALGRALGIDPGDDLALEWTESADPNTQGIWVKALALDLVGVDEGEYTIELRASVGGLSPVSVSRVITVFEEAGD